MPAVIYEAEPGIHGVWHYVSPQIKKLIGDSPEDWMSSPDFYARRIHPADRKAVFETEENEFDIALREDGATVVAEYRMLHADGHLVWVRDELVYPWLGPDRGRRYLGFFWTLFFFILLANLAGEIPFPLNPNPSPPARYYILPTSAPSPRSAPRAPPDPAPPS